MAPDPKTTTQKPATVIKATGVKSAPARPAPIPVTPPAPATRDDECAKLGRHRSRCGCTGEMRAPIK